MSAVFGDAGSSVDVAVSGGEVAPPDSSVEPEQSTAGDVVEAGQQPEGSQPQVQEEETDVSKLDLTQPEHLQKFRSSYEKKSYLLGEAEREREEARKELADLRASSGRGVYLSTDVPLEDFDPRDGLIRMMEEEPLYYERVAADFMDTHFWPDLGHQIKSIEGVNLDFNNPADAEKLESLNVAWDTLARRMTRGNLDGDALFGVLEILEKSPDLQQVILARLNGAPGPSLHPQAGAPAYGQQQQQGYGQQMPNVDAIAAQFGLDPTDPAHAQLINQIQADQQMRVQADMQRQRERAQAQMQITALQNQIAAIRNDQEGLKGQSSQEAERRAETKLNEQLESMLDADIQSRYGNAVPKDRPELVGDIKIIAKANLDNNPDYKTAVAKATKWFKQAASAQTMQDRERWEKAGLDALAAVSVYRAKAIQAAAERHLGPIRRTTARQNQRTQELQRGRREIPGGQATPPVQPRQQAPVGDVQATRDAIRQRLRNAQGQGVQGLPRV